MNLNLYISDHDKIAKDVVLHPPHLTNNKGQMMPSALIPFCAYQSHKSFLGETMENGNLTFCKGFHPIVLEGQLCYTLKIADEVRGKSNTKGQRVGLLLALDPGNLPNNVVTNGALFKL